MTTATDPESDGADDWIPATDAPPLDEERTLDRLELMDEVTHPVRGRLLRHLRRPHSAAELADVLEVPITRLYHHLNRLEEQGLVDVVATRRVGARTERRYRASAGSYSISPDVLREFDPPALAKALGKVFDLARLEFEREVESGALVDELLAAADRDRSESVILSFGSLRLDDDRRRELVERIAALVEEFRHDDGAQTLTTFLAAFPTT